MNTSFDVTGIGDLVKVRTAAEKYKAAIIKETQFFTYNENQGMVGTNLNAQNTGKTTGALVQYKSAVISKMKKTVSVLDKLIQSIDNINTNYSTKVTSAAVSKLSSSANNLKS